MLILRTNREKVTARETIFGRFQSKLDEAREAAHKVVLETSLVLTVTRSNPVDQTLLTEARSGTSTDNVAYHAAKP
jgi:hypothetical protein